MVACCGDLDGAGAVIAPLLRVGQAAAAAAAAAAAHAIALAAAEDSARRDSLDTPRRGSVDTPRNSGGGGDTPRSSSGKGAPDTPPARKSSTGATAPSVEMVSVQDWAGAGRAEGPGEAAALMSPRGGDTTTAAAAAAAAGAAARGDADNVCGETPRRSSSADGATMAGAGVDGAGGASEVAAAAAVEAAAAAPGDAVVQAPPPVYSRMKWARTELYSKSGRPDASASREMAFALLVRASRRVSLWHKYILYCIVLYCIARSGVELDWIVYNGLGSSGM